MLQYLLNATAIWLMSLVLFDVFLRRESFHRYNRFYLLFTFVLGALFPLVQWQGSSNLYPSTLERPIARVITAKQTVIEATTPATSINWSQWLFIAYLAGAAVVLILLLSEIIKLTAYYHSGKRSKQDGWTIIETSKEHAPFSFLNLLFVCSTEQYNTEEWCIILKHEKRHHTLLHFSDLLLMQLGRIVFWFHPLVYVYNKRLLLIHEYQADKATAAQPQVYGKFLVEQALLQSAPSISHSFNRSPIKKRIVMLTRRSSAASGIKMLVFIPLALICVFCFSKNSFSQKKGKDIVGVIAFGIDDTAVFHYITYDQMLANPTIVCKEADWQIVSFTFSLFPKRQDYWGPFKTDGTTRLGQRQIEFIQKLKETKHDTTRVFIEGITAKRNGKEVHLTPKIFIATP